MDNVTFDLRSAERIARSVKFTERQAEDLTGGRGRFITANNDSYNFPVLVTTDGGSAGTATTQISATYTVTDLGGNPMPDGSSSTATLKSPEMNRALLSPNPGKVGIAPAGSIGTACYDGASPPALHLLWVKETPGFGC